MSNPIPIPPVRAGSKSLAPTRDVPGPPPDGGLRAWVQVLMAHLVMFNTWGFITSFGIFESYYSSALDRSRSDISWIGSIQIFLVYFVGAFSGRATDAGYCRTVLISGLSMQLIGVFTTSVSQQYWQLFVAQGLCQGLGNGLVFCPTISLISTYFSKKRTLAIALVASGTSTGGIVFPLVAQQLLHRLGFPWTLRVMGFIMLANSLVIMSLVRVRLRPRESGRFFELSAFRELPYSLFCIGSFLIIWAVYFAYYYISIFSQNIIGVSRSTSFTILLIMNAVGIPGRAVPAFLADRYAGPLSIFIPVCFVAGVLLYAWAAVHDFPGLLAFCIFYGVFGAGAQALFPASCSSLTVDLSKIGVRTGMVFSIVSIASLTGPPLAGILIERRGGDFLYAQIFGGTAFIAGGLTLIGARFSHTGLDWKHRM
ncbi:hypothetical protein GX50_01816 [[Emmonsia] crescens]|uniref:Major facilitator superfamily (MFS) profile domain-containing protein n=1 Tax=[Emmonsia] crescens TaxID=73230 RepID=A0A2B7ZQS5_9EURO|nr:hypothetical protein GX50_01816 [Emmonsia crescens]